MKHLSIFKRVDYRSVLIVDAINLLKASHVNPHRKCRYSRNLVVRTFLTLIRTFRYRSSLPSNKISKDGISSIFFIESFDREYLLRETSLLKVALGSNVFSIILQQKVRVLNFAPTINALALALCCRRKIFRDIGLINAELGYIERLFLFSQCIQAISDAVLLFPAYAKAKAVCSFQEMSASENIICQVANILKIRTYGFVHSIGLGAVEQQLEEDIITKYTNLDVSSIKASVCKVVFCWGEIQRSLFQNFTSATPVIVGKASVYEGSPSSGGITLVFDSDASASTRLLDFATGLTAQGVPVSLWFKPGSELASRYGVARVGPLRSVVLGNKSSLLPQLALAGCAVFVLNQSVFVRFLPKSMVITDLNDLLRASSNLKEYNTDIWKRFIAYNGVVTMKKIQKHIANDLSS